VRRPACAVPRPGACQRPLGVPPPHRVAGAGGAARGVVTGRRLRVEVDYHRGVGSSICVLTAPRTFALNEHGQSTVTDPEGDPVETVLEAAEGCPTMAITVFDADTGEQLFP